MTDPQRRAAVAERAARAGAQVAHERFRTDVDVERKAGKTDVVTQADRDAQDRVVEVVRESFPDDAIVGEEADTRKRLPEAGPAWVIDPIDGTSNYVRDLPVWGTSVAAVVDGEPVAAATVMPALGDVYRAADGGATRNGEEITVSDREDPETFTVCPTTWWELDERDQFARAAGAIVERFGDMRRWGSAHAALATVADGGLEGAITNLRASPWDTVGGVHLIRAAGGTVTDLEGDRWRHDSRGLVASNGRNHDLVLDAARQID